MQEIINDFSRDLKCGSINLKVACLSIILYLSHVDPNFNIGQGTWIGDNNICQAYHIIDVITLTYE